MKNASFDIRDCRVVRAEGAAAPRGSRISVPDFSARQSEASALMLAAAQADADIAKRIGAGLRARGTRVAP